MVEVNKMLSKSIDDRTMAQQRATVNSIEEEMAKNSKRISQLDKKVGLTLASQKHLNYVGCENEMSS